MEGLASAVTVSGLIYNLGLLAGPWFEGKMTGCLVDILKRNKAVWRYAVSGNCLCGSDSSGGTDIQIYQAVLCQTIYLIM